MTTYELFIYGKWRPASDRATIPAVNTYNQEVHAQVSVATAGDVEEAVSAARKAFDSVWVNTYRVAAPQAPFGGMKDSGFGRVRGEAGIQEFMQTKNVFIDFSGDKRDPFAMKF